MDNLLNGFLDENIFKELLLAFIFFISSIIFAINQNIMDKEYQKKYIIVSYLLFFILFVFFGNTSIKIIDSALLFLVITFLLNVICGLNYGYKSDTLSKFLGRRRLLVFKTVEWFFITKSYIFYVFILVLKIISHIFIRVNVISNLVYYCVFMLFFIYHLLTNMIDTFGIFPFTHLSNTFFNAKEYFKNYKTDEKNPTDFVHILGFLVFVEDKDFFDRKGAVFNPYFVLKRKINNLKMRQIKGENKPEKKVKVELIYFLKAIKYAIKLLFKIMRNIKSYIRGFSSIEQQIVRVLIMYPDTYEKYIFRRKIFVEWIVNPMFFKAFRERRKVIRKIKRISYDEYKVEILLFYYKEILKMPKTFEELIDKLSFSSRLNRINLEVLLDKYNTSSLKIKYKDVLEKELIKLKMDHLLLPGEALE